MHRPLAVRVMHKMFVVLPGIVLWAARMYENVLTYAAVAVGRACVTAVLELFQL